MTGNENLIKYLEESLSSGKPVQRNVVQKLVDKAVKANEILSDEAETVTDCYVEQLRETLDELRKLQHEPENIIDHVQVLIDYIVERDDVEEGFKDSWYTVYINLVNLKESLESEASDD